MTLLAILRHAKSSWDDSALDDFDRPLNDRGRKAARRVGREMKARGMRFDQVLASPAARVRETLDEVARGYGGELDVRFDDALYGASAEALLGFVRAIPGKAHAPLLVGHDPGLHQLVLRLTRDDGAKLRGRIAAKFPTGALAMIALDATRWDEVEPGSGEIRELILPRDLE